MNADMTGFTLEQYAFIGILAVAILIICFVIRWLLSDDSGDVD